MTEELLKVNTILQGNALQRLKKLPNDCIDCCISSPPYWNLRDYKIEGQLGLEPTFNEYLEKLLSIYDEVRRVLKPTGTVFVNLGDTYNGSKRGNTNNAMKEGIADMDLAKQEDKRVAPKSLLAIPDRFKIAMIDRGWICRNEIIWYKRNCMPSSAKDRFTVDFEKIFFFVKQERYFFETQYEPYSETTIDQLLHRKITTPAADKYVGTDIQGGENFQKRHIAKMREGMPKFGGNKAAGYGNPTYSGDEWEPTFGRLKRCVWDITTQGFEDAHFATFPEELVENCIKPGCPVEGICLDPFFGSGTVGLVAMKLARNFIGIELNSEYITMAMKRLDPYLKQERLF